MKNLTETEFNLLKKDLSTRSIKTVKKVWRTNHLTFKAVRESIDYEDYQLRYKVWKELITSGQGQWNEKSEYIAPISNFDLMKELKEIREILERLDLRQ